MDNKKSFDPSQIQASLLERLPQYTRIADCLSGSDAIKAKTDTYLPRPNPEDESDENNTRYDQYIERAVFYNVTGKTVSGLVGIAFNKPIPNLIVPSNQQYIMDNVDGAGVTLEQQIKRTTSVTISYGRCGLFVDYSKNPAETQQDVLDGKVRAAIIMINPHDIIWVETKTIGIKTILSLVVIQETYQKETGDGYTTEEGVQYRVLVVDQYYRQEIWRQTGEKNSWEIIEDESSEPKDNNGNYFEEMPFTFVGSINNDYEFDESPILTIADLNISHYRNSADAEESSFIHGQPTLIISGLTQNWVDDVLKGSVRVGARGGIPLPVGASGTLIQPQENLLPVNGMREKEKQMAAIGARIVTDTTGAKTATEVSRDTTVENSELSNIMGNVEQAYKFCFERIVDFTGITGYEIELTKRFVDVKFEPQTYLALVNGMMNSSNQKEDVFNYLKNTDMVDQDIEYDDWLETINNELPVSDLNVDSNFDEDVTDE